MTVGDAEARHVAVEPTDQREAQEARELASLSRWNKQTTVIGGVEMTNEQAQHARQNIIDNDEAYADWAVRKGLIGADDKDAFKAGIRRKKDLEDKRGRGNGPRLGDEGSCPVAGGRVRAHRSPHGFSIA